MKFRYSSLHLAAMGGHKDMASLILENNAEVLSFYDNHGMTPLLRAARGNNEHVVRLLLVKGADIMALDNKTQGSALGYLVRTATRSLSLVEYMIELGADINHKDSSGGSIVQYAAQERLVHILKLLVRKGADISSLNNAGQAPLDVAACYGRDRALEYLIDQGCDVEHRDKWSLTPLLKAVQKGHEGVVKLLLAQGASVTTVENLQQTPLHYSARHGQERIAELLLDRGAYIESRDIFGFAPILRAAHCGQSKCVEYLLERGAHIRAVSLKNNDAAALALTSGHKLLANWILENDRFSYDFLLHKAAAVGNTQTLKLLLDRNPDRINERDADGKTALHKACAKNSVSAVDLLCSSGADIDSLDEEGRTPLSHSCTKGLIEVVGVLLANGADVSKPDAQGHGPIHGAARLVQTSILELLLDHKADIEQKARNDETALYLAAAGGKEAVVQLLIRQGVNLDALVLPNRNTAVAKAIYNSHITVAQTLIEAGCDIHCKDGLSQRSPLMIAAITTDSAHLVNLLLDRGAKLNERDVNGATPLALAASNDRKKIFDAMLIRGADVNSTDTNGWTPLMRTVRWKRDSGTRMLLDAGADVSLRITESQRTILHLAATYHTSATIAQMLIDHGAELESQDAQNATPLVCAAAENRSALLRCLLDNGANIEAENEDGLTPLLQVAKLGTAAQVQLLLDNGANIDARDKTTGSKAIHMAARHNGSLDVAILLLERGAQINGCAGRNETALLFAAVAGKTTWVKEFLKHGADVNQEPNDNSGSPLLGAVKALHEETAIMLVEAGADCNAIDNVGWRTIHYAIRSHLYKLVGRMLETGASPNMLIEKGSELPGDSGLTALHVAVKEGSPKEVIRSLLDHGADIEAKTTKFGNTALLLLPDSRYLALSDRKSEEELAEKLELMLEYGADLHYRNKFGVALISATAYFGYVKLIETLLAKGADLHHKIGSGQTLLHRATYVASVTVAEFLMAKGLDPTAVDKFGETCLMTSVTNARVDMVKLLLRTGTSNAIMKASSDGKTPIKVARESLAQEKNKKTPNETKISSLLEIIDLIMDYQVGSSERRFSSTRKPPLTVKSW